jgi:hypothetical protein
MINASVRLRAILCHVTYDQGSSSEPYMWSSFFNLDINTISRPSGNRLVTHTPHANWTTRGVFPDGIQAGDVADIPASLGDYTVNLDPGGLGIAVVGALFVLLEQDRTPGNAIRAGHEEFEAAVDEVLNDYVDSVFPNPDISITPAQIQQIANQIQNRVTSAIRDELSWYQLTYPQDDFIGFGYRVLTHGDLQRLAARPYGRQSFTTRITSSKYILNRIYSYDYEVFGEVVAVEDDNPYGETNAEYEVYRSAVDSYTSIDKTIRDLEHQLQETPSGRRELITELIRLRQEAQPQALEQLADARMAYNRTQSHDIDRSEIPSASDRGGQPSVRHGHLFPEEALVATPNDVYDVEG